MKMIEKTQHSKWKYAEKWSIVDEYIFGKNEYWWSAFNIENCKSGYNKNCYMAMYRAAKNKKRIIKYIKRKITKS